MIKYKIKRKIVNCEKLKVWRRSLFTPLAPPVTNCHTFSDPSPLWSVTYFMDGPIVRFYIEQNAYTYKFQ